MTKLKKNAKFKLVQTDHTKKERKLEGVTPDYHIKIKSGKRTLVLRKIGYKDPKTKRFYYFFQQ